MFRDRVEAGIDLGRRLAHLEDLDPVVLALPGGGVPVAAEVARALDAPLDVIIVGKLGVPRHPEVAMGAVGEGGVRHVDWNVVASAGLGAEAVRESIAHEMAELVGRAARLRAGRPPLQLDGRSVIIVDDGIATGSSVTAAAMVARELGAPRVTIAVPVAPTEVIQRLERVADEVVVIDTPDQFQAVAEVYQDFREIDDDEVVGILRLARMRVAAERR